jgi:endo-1,4-beta-xylanase
VYSTTSNIADPGSWAEPRPLVQKTECAKWIDFWVICDQMNAYLFLTRDHKEAVVMTTRLEDFPCGFGSPRAVLAPVHEAVHVYRVQGRGTPEYVMLYEQQEHGDIRYFGLARSTRLGSVWRISDERFASSERLSGEAGQRWTDEVSHCELLRIGFDERLEIPRRRWDFLIQGIAPSCANRRVPAFALEAGADRVRPLGTRFRLGIRLALLRPRSKSTTAEASPTSNSPSWDGRVS